MIYALHRESEEREIARVRTRGGRQLNQGGGGGGGGVSECETKGFETRIRQDCEVVTETVCSNLTVTRFRKEIETTCTTRVSIKQGSKNGNDKHFITLLNIFEF